MRLGFVALLDARARARREQRAADPPGDHAGDEQDEAQGRLAEGREQDAAREHAGRTDRGEDPAGHAARRAGCLDLAQRARGGRTALLERGGLVLELHRHLGLLAQHAQVRLGQPAEAVLQELDRIGLVAAGGQ